MATPLVDLTVVDPTGALTLVVGWRSGRKMKLRQLIIGGSVEAEFRNVISAALSDLGGRESAPWSPEADLSPETYLMIDAAELGPAPELVTEHSGITFYEALVTGENLEILAPQQIPAANLSFYALIVGDTPGQRAAFLRRTNPQRGLKRGRIYTFLADSLQRISDPIFAFDAMVDLVFLQSHVCVLSQTVFASLFRDQDTLAAQVPAWASDLQSHIPITDDGRTRLTHKALTDTRLRARLEAIVRRGHLPTVSPATMRSAMVATGLDPTALLDSAGQLVLADADIPQVLHFLNEDLFDGVLTNTQFRADKKASR